VFKLLDAVEPIFMALEMFLNDVIILVGIVFVKFKIVVNSIQFTIPINFTEAYMNQELSESSSWTSKLSA